MPFNIFSKRQRALRGEAPDVYQYETISAQLRAQIIHLLKDAFGERSRYGADHLDPVRSILHREYGVFNLSKLPTNTSRTELFSFVANDATTEQVLDVVEVAMAILKRDSGGPRATLNVAEAVDELNTRFREHAVGFQYESGEIVRVDSRLIHQEVVRPTLAVLSDRRYAGAESEFLKAHEHHRHGRDGEAINECLKALESTLKVICKKRGWAFKETDTAKALLDTVFANRLVPEFLQGEFTALRAAIESGVPTTRNRTSGHGAGSVPKTVPPHLASYILHLTAASILFLTDAEKHLP